MKRKDKRTLWSVGLLAAFMLVCLAVETKSLDGKTPLNEIEESSSSSSVRSSVVSSVISSFISSSIVAPCSIKSSSIRSSVISSVVSSYNSRTTSTIIHFEKLPKGDVNMVYIRKFNPETWSIQIQEL